MIPNMANFPLQFPIQQSYPISSPYISNMPSLPYPFLPYYSPLIDYSSLLKAKQSLQSQLLSYQLASLPKTEASTPSLSTNFSKTFLASPVDTNTPSPQSFSEVRAGLDLPDDPEIRLEAQVKYMVQFFVNNYGLIKAKDVQAARKRYVQDEKLLKAFDALTTKYSTTSKTREEMVKWIVRRALKTSKQAMKGEQKKDQRKLLQDLCKRYFKGGESPEEEEEADNGWVDSVLPFRKNSKNKTMNSTFITEIFKSEEFRQDYKEFLRDFDEITDKENNEKIRRFCRLIVDCVKKGTFEPIIKYKRVPWLRLWVQNTKKSALELDEDDCEEKSVKKVKCDE